jgi:hypothetical protein
MKEKIKVWRCAQCPTDGSRCKYEDVCVCGTRVDAHTADDGHAPVAMHFHFGEMVEVASERDIKSG